MNPNIKRIVEPWMEKCEKLKEQNQELTLKVERLSKRGICDMQHQIKELKDFIDDMSCYIPTLFEDRVQEILNR